MAALANATWAGWVFPLPTLGGRVPVVSDGFSRTATSSHREHLGVDIMYRRLPTEPAELPRGTKLFFLPADTPVLAAFGGKVWSANVGDFGHSVTIDHGDVPGVGPCVTFYQHMSSFARAWKKGDKISAGDKLGIVGGSPTGYPLHHLHFELWLPVRSNAVDPAPHMAKWEKRSAPGGLDVRVMALLAAIAGSMWWFFR